MSATRPPSFQFYPANWFADTRRMTRDQRCRYFEALMESWLEESYGICTEDHWRELLGYTPKEWSRARSAFAPRFQIEGGMWTQKKLYEVRADQVLNREKSKRGADATNVKRWHYTPDVSHSDNQATVGRSLNRRSTVTPASASASAVEPDKTLAAKDSVGVPGPGTPEHGPGTAPPPGVAADDSHRREAEPRPHAPPGMTAIASPVSGILERLRANRTEPES